MVKGARTLVYPASEEEARAHITQIRQSRGIDDANGPFSSSANIKDLERALVVLSDDLYQSPTHFLLELIQNADDNNYAPSTSPTVILSKRPGWFRIDCNELGFSRANVDAICRVGDSTKRRELGCTGEKGIGFKAVFRVASEVYISSGHYSFCFDASSPLGKVAPGWKEFPEEKKPGFTTILLRLSESYCEADLSVELSKFDARTLIFLRRLRRVEISIDTGVEKFDEKTLTRTDVSESITELAVDDKVTKYFLHAHNVTRLPIEDRRPGVSSSEIRLSFPFQDDGSTAAPVIERQPIFSFLPIRDYGLPFLLQGDFLLVANRGDIDTSDWNKALQFAAADAYCDAISALRKSQHSMRYCWARYLPTETCADKSFEALRERILQKVRESRFVEDAMGNTFNALTALKLVPGKYRETDEKAPVSLCHASGPRYLSSGYSQEEVEKLKATGVEELSQPQFFQDLKQALEERISPQRPWTPKLKDQTADEKDFHREVAVVVLRTLKTNSEAADLPIIPLRDGTWATPKKTPIFFPTGLSRGGTVPDGLKLNTIRDDFAKIQFCRYLYTRLGVREFGDDDIAEVIVQTHRSDDCVKMLTPQMAVSHAMFLYRVKFENAKKAPLWVATEDGGFRRSTATYMRLPLQEGQASHYLKADRKSTFGFLHPLYSETFGPIPNHVEFLRQALGLEVFPRLVNEKFVDRLGFPTTDEAELLIHPDFTHVLGLPNQNDALTVLANGWEDLYAETLVDLSTALKLKKKKDVRPLKLAAHEISAFLKGTKFPCLAPESMFALRESILPLAKLKEEAPWCRNFLDVPNPEDSTWEFLRHLGVTITNDLNFYIEALRQAKSCDSPVSFSQIKSIMAQIQARSSDDKDLVRRAFRGENLICRPVGDDDGEDADELTWVGLGNCVWKGEPWLKTVTSLTHLFPDCHRLFSDVLGVCGLHAAHIVQEMMAFTTASDIKYIASVFKLVKKMDEDGQLGSLDLIVDTVRRFDVIPVRKCSVEEDGESESFEKLVSMEDKTWFIADRMEMRTAFANNLDVLAFDLATVKRFIPLFDLLQMGHRLLSRDAEVDITQRGDLTTDGELTCLYGAMSPYIVRLVPQDDPKRDELLRLVRNVSIKNCDRIYISFIVKSNSSIRSRELPVPVHIDARSPGELTIYVQHGHLDEEPPLRLSGLLSEILHIKDEWRNLLMLVLMRVAPAKLDVWFREAGVPSQPDDGRYAVTGGYGGGAAGVAGHLTRKDVITMTMENLGDFQPMTGSLEDVLSGGFPSVMVLFPAKKGSGDVSVQWPGLGPSLGGSARWKMILKDTGVQKSTSSTTQFNGENIVSSMLQGMLGAHYDPETHWTSPHRVRAGHASYTSRDFRASFTVPDKGGRIAHFLAHKGFRDAALWTKKGNVVFHVDVSATTAPHGQAFHMTSPEFERAKSYSPSRIGTDVPSDVSIWIHISRIGTKDERSVAFLVDPWKLWLNGEISLGSVGGYSVQCK